MPGWWKILKTHHLTSVAEVSSYQWLKCSWLITFCMESRSFLGQKKPHWRYFAFYEQAARSRWIEVSRGKLGSGVPPYCLWWSYSEWWAIKECFFENFDSLFFFIYLRERPFQLWLARLTFFNFEPRQFSNFGETFRHLRSS
jgi:hypothetical protein